MLRLKDYYLKSLFQESICKEYAVSLKPLEEGEKISILSDSMFKTMFQNENRLKYSCKFLSYFLDTTYEELLNNIHLAKNESDKRQEKDKNERCDYVAYIKGTYINIEVNNNSSLETMERNIEYLMRLYARKVKKGKNMNIHHLFLLISITFLSKEMIRLSIFMLFKIKKAYY